MRALAQTGNFRIFLQRWTLFGIHFVLTPLATEYITPGEYRTVACADCENVDLTYAAEWGIAARVSFAGSDGVGIA